MSQPTAPTARTSSPRTKRTTLSPAPPKSTARADAPPQTTTHDSDDDDSSVLSSSSEEPSSDESSEADSSDDDEIVNLRSNRGKKPAFKLNKREMGPDIRDFLKTFIPQLKAANEELEAQKKAGTLKKIEVEEKMEVDGGEKKEGDDDDMEVDEAEKAYIEMDLGLGVLEVRDDKSDVDMESVNGEDALEKLMGKEKVKKTVVVQEVDTQQS